MDEWVSRSTLAQELRISNRAVRRFERVGLFPRARRGKLPLDFCKARFILHVSGAANPPREREAVQNLFDRAMTGKPNVQAIRYAAAAVRGYFAECKQDVPGPVRSSLQAAENEIMAALTWRGCQLLGPLMGVSASRLAEQIQSELRG